MADNKEIMKKLKSYYGSNYIRDTDIDFIKKSENEIVIRMHRARLFEEDPNMQKDNMAFEGWACVLYEMLKYTQSDLPRILLDLDEDLDVQEYLGNGHICRFLYRLLRFEEQYGKWFCLSDRLEKEVRKFGEFIKNNKFINNRGEGEAGNKTKHNKENVQEERLSQPGEVRKLAEEQCDFDFGNNPVYRQLRVGLFCGDKVDPSQVIFPGNKSAIDMWSWNESAFEVIELKTENKKIGIVTEIFFYCNYMRDLLLEDGEFKLNKDVPKDDRGYHILVENNFTKIRGIMLADIYHPFTGKGSKILDVLNDNGNTPIEYYRLVY